MSEDKVRTKDLCWSVGTLYDSIELPGVSTVGPGIGRGVIEGRNKSQIKHNKRDTIDLFIKVWFPTETYLLVEESTYDRSLSTISLSNDHLDYLSVSSQIERPESPRGFPHKLGLPH
jgi:hypothetical protein